MKPSFKSTESTESENRHRKWGFRACFGFSESTGTLLHTLINEQQVPELFVKQETWNSGPLNPERVCKHSIWAAMSKTRWAELPCPNLHHRTDTHKHFPIGPLGQDRHARTEKPHDGLLGCDLMNRKWRNTKCLCEFFFCFFFVKITVLLNSHIRLVRRCWLVTSS